MSYFIIQRDHGRDHDYLVGFDSVWGTVCGGSRPLRFPDVETAQVALRKARRSYRSYNGRRIVQADGRCFRVVERFEEARACRQ